MSDILDTRTKLRGRWRQKFVNIFYVSFSAISRDECDADCKKEDSEIVPIGDEATETYLEDMLVKRPRRYWIGLRNYGTDGNTNWKFTDGLQPKQTFWAHDEPKLHTGNCVVLGFPCTPLQCWFSEECSQTKRRCICRKSAKIRWFRTSSINV